MKFSNMKRKFSAVLAAVTALSGAAGSVLAEELVTLIRPDIEIVGLSDQTQEDSSSLVFRLSDVLSVYSEGEADDMSILPPEGDGS